ncbi:hypothetical protein [Caryophanon latum]|uniref:Uncharacterized protein n=1 Tax=Caryophanon latum TaxID=33977 RepID=A0A1C0YUZ8_9BACL|nr:hypothetical protein [Caryophanon latum]OCS90959.1 hypothetical protein A6K76_10320 [Caryophanon latum]
MTNVNILKMGRIAELNEVKTSYKDSKNIIDCYNQSILFYKDHLFYLDSHSYSGAKQQLIPAGTLLYNVMEWAYKHLLHETYRKEREKGKINSNKCKDLQGKLKKSGTKNNFLVSQIKHFYQNELDANDINLDTVAQYSYILNNGPKHYAEDPDKEKFEVIAEIVKRFILVFIDNNAFLRPIKELNEFNSYTELLELFVLENENNHYILITQDEKLDITSCQNLLKIKWDLVMDFDIYSDEKGLLNYYKSKSALRPIVGDLTNNTIRELNIRREMPYWIMGRGYSDRPETIIESNMFIRKYGRFLSDYFQQFRSLYTQPLKIIILNQNKLLVERLMQDIDAVYADFTDTSNSVPDYEIILFKDTLVDLDPIINAKILKYDYAEFIDFLNNLPQTPTKDVINYVIPADPYEENNNKIVYELESEFFEELKVNGELLYIDIDQVDYNTYDETEDREKFYKGETEISWMGIKRHFDVERKEMFNTLRREIEKLLVNRGTAEKSIQYIPGVGGTTILRRIAFEFHSKYPTIILKNYLDGITDNALFELYRKARKTIFILIDSNNFTKDNLNKLRRALTLKSFPYVLLHFEREVISKKSSKTESTIDYFSKDEEQSMKDKLLPYIRSDIEARNRLLELVKSSKHEDRIPIIMSLTAFQEDFKGLSNYIRGFLQTLNPTQKRFLVYLSIVDYAINKPIEETFFRKSGDEIFPLISSNAFVHLIKINYNEKTFKIKYPIFSQEILRQISNPNEDRSERKGIIISNLLEYILEFIEDSRFLSTSTSKKTEILLRELFITREENDMIKDKFAPLIEKIISESPDNQNVIIGNIFKKLSEIYPEEPHYLGHLARYYFYIDKNYKMGKETIKNALDIFEQKEGNKDSHLYHMQAMGQVAEITSKLIPEIKEASRLDDAILKRELMQKIKHEANIAFEIFEEVRSLSAKGLAINLAGYISDISLCINLVDMGVRIEGKNGISDFLADSKIDGWYKSVIDRAFNLFEDSKKFPLEDNRNINSDVEASIQKIKGNLNEAISIWEKYIQSDNPDNPRVRRMLARAYEENLDFQNNQENYYKNLESIKELMEYNMKIEPDNGNNIRIWFEAIRKTSSSSSEATLDQAILKLQQWIAESDTIEAHYYYFILAFIKAVNNSTEYEQKLPYLLNKLKEKSFNSPNSRKTFEWLGFGDGLDSLITDKDFYKKEKDERDLARLRTLTGRITPNFSTSNQAAYISIFGIDVFFNPTYTVGIDRSKKNQRVQFGVGFSFEGPRAFNSTVKLVEASTEELNFNDETLVIGETVKFEVTGELEYYYTGIITKNKSLASIHKNKLGIDHKPSLGMILDLKVVRKKYINGKGEVWELENLDLNELNTNNIIAAKYEEALKRKNQNQ